MNYKKQIPLSYSEIAHINCKEGIGVFDIPTYPKGYIHTRISWDAPIEITRNEDEVWFNNFTESNKENYWLVYKNVDEAEKSFKFETKQFENIDDAINYARFSYVKFLYKKLSPYLV